MIAVISAVLFFSDSLLWMIVFSCSGIESGSLKKYHNSVAKQIFFTINGFKSFRLADDSSLS